MTIDFDEIRKQVAIKHNVLLGKDDPILVTVTLMDIVLDRHLELVNDQLLAANRALAVSLQQQVDQSKETAGKVITEAANYVSDQVRLAVNSVLSDAGNDLKRQMANAQSASADALAGSRDAQTAKSSAIIAAALAGVAALVSVAALIVVLIK